MPVSKKRKKDGKPVQRSAPPEAGEAHPHGPDQKPEAGRPAGGKPSNPFVAQQQSRRGAQRGR
jgi:hypothetical protein